MKNYLSFKRGLLTAFIVLVSLATSLAVEVTVNFSTSLGIPLQGADVSFRTATTSFVSIGTTDVNGQILNADLGNVVGNATFIIYYDGANTQQSQNVYANSTVNFQTVLTTFILEDQLGNELVGTNTRYHSGGWKTFGSGTTTTQQELLPTSYPFRVSWNGGVKDITKNISASNNEIIVVITEATVILLDSEGNSLVSDNIQYLVDGVWEQFGSGNSPETIEVLPVLYNFRIYYNGAYQQKQQHIGEGSTVVFQTSSVNYQSSGTIEYSFGGGGLIPFNSPMELLPVLYTFEFSNSGYPNKALNHYITENEVKSLAFIYFLNSENTGIEGSPTQIDDFGWQAGAMTGNDGVSLNLIEGLATTVTSRVYYGGTYEDVEQDVSTNSYIDFNTISVSMDLENSLGNPLESSNAEYYANGWQQFGSGVTSESIELLPQAYNFRVSYAKGQNSKVQDVSVDPMVSFSTIPVTVNLMNSNGIDIESSNAMYIGFDGSINQFGDGFTPVTKELLPNEYTFRVLYAGATIDKDQNVTMDANVDFNTIPVTMNVYDANGNVLNGTDATYSFSGSTIFGDGTTPGVMELLPVSYDFSVMYDGNPMATNQNTAFYPNVSFTITEAIPALVSLEEDMLFEEEQLFMDEELFGSNSTSFEMEEIKTPTVNAYPNPFSESITLSYEVETDAKVNISVYNMNGVLISTLVDGNMHKGNYEVKWNADDNGGSRVPNGTYIYRIAIDNKVESNTIILQN